MKLLRYGDRGQEKPGMLDGDGALRDLSGQVHDLAGEVLTPAGLDKLRALDPASLPKVEGSGAGQIHLAPETARLFQSAEELAKKAGDEYVVAMLSGSVMVISGNTGEIVARRSRARPAPEILAKRAPGARPLVRSKLGSICSRRSIPAAEPEVRTPRSTSYG